MGTHGRILIYYRPSPRRPTCVHGGGRVLPRRNRLAGIGPAVQHNRKLLKILIHFPDYWLYWQGGEEPSKKAAAARQDYPEIRRDSPATETAKYC
jgi:hypothetical protein